jgi:DNA-binding MarR family transcriptional regulator
METQGLIKREQMKLDRRTSALTLTEKGKELLRIIDEEISEWYDAKLATENEEEIEAIIKGFNAFRVLTRKLASS